MALPIAPRVEPVGNNPPTPQVPPFGDMPRPRDITDQVMDQDASENIPNSFDTNEYLQFFGQFLTHDMTESATGDSGDPPLFLDGLPFPFTRTPYEMEDGVRQQLNDETSYLDLSQVYGLNDDVLGLLRANNADGTDSPYLLMGNDNLLPTYNEVAADSGLPVGTPFDGGADNTVLGILIPETFPGAGALTPDEFAAGDNRLNQQVPLMSQHTTWAREHNYQVDKLKAMFPYWTDDELFEAAKAIVEAEWQHVVYNEYLPALLGEGALSEYTGYDPNVDPSIINEFTTAAFRLGHDQSTNLLQLLLENGQDGASGPQTLAQAFGAIGTIANSADLDEWIRGQLSQHTQEIDGKVVDGNRNLLFAIGPPGNEATVDLEVFDIQRGRDHGVNDYNTVRQALGLDPYADFDAFGADNNVDPATLDALKTLYGDDIGKLDTIIGGLLEQKVEGSQLGETFHTLTVMQFEALRDGDRFYYENRFADNPKLLAEIESTSLADIIARTSPGIEYLYHDGFAAHNRIGGDDGNNTIVGNPDGADGPHDLLMGYGGNDRLRGKKGDDDLYGGEGRDRLFGGKGNDHLNGEEGNDKLWGGRGYDIFVFEKGTGRDKVLDFNPYQDKIDLSDFGFKSYYEVLWAARHKGHNTVIDLEDGDKVQLVGVKLWQLSPDNFILDDGDHEHHYV